MDGISDKPYSRGEEFATVIGQSDDCYAGKQVPEGNGSQMVSSLIGSRVVTAADIILSKSFLLRTSHFKGGNVLAGPRRGYRRKRRGMNLFELSDRNNLFLTAIECCGIGIYGAESPCYDLT